MVKPRIYRHDPVSSTGQAMRCPHCGSNWIPKDGRSRGKQTYRCGDRKYRFTPDGNRHYYSEEVKRQALSMYSEISSISAIARVMNVKLGTVFSWVKKVHQAQTLMDIRRADRGQKPELPASVRTIRRVESEPQPLRVISFDEMWTYQGSRRRGLRRSVWVWTAAVEEKDGRRWSDFEVGDRDYETFIRLYRRLPESERYRSGPYQIYEWLPSDHHVVGKGSEANWNEGLHSKLRVKLNRLVRSTRGYSKSLDMLSGSLWVVGLV